jgi:hypothetical protein
MPNGSWFHKHKVQIIFIVILAFFVPLTIVHCLFKLKNTIPFFAAEWQAGDVLAYIAGFEAFLGTIVLGCIAVYQTKQANYISHRLLELQENNDRPFIAILPVKQNQSINESEEIRFIFNDYAGSKGSHNTLEYLFQIENIGNAYIASIELCSISVDGTVTRGYRTVDAYLAKESRRASKIILDNRDSYKLTEDTRTAIELTFLLRNHLGEKYIQKINLICLISLKNQEGHQGYKIHAITNYDSDKPQKMST